MKKKFEINMNQKKGSAAPKKNKIIALIERIILRLRGAEEVKAEKGNDLVSKNWHSPY